MPMPEQLTVKSYAKIFLELAKERYPTVERILKISDDLGIAKDDIRTKIFLFTQFRLMIKDMDPERIFETLEHRDEIYDAILDTLEELEDDLEELEAEEEEYDFLEFDEDEEDEEEDEEDEKEEGSGFWDIDTSEYE
ncbi:MAG: hypothetical protein HN411_02075 [Waddliaceae bacterium]|jgi:hypothetical protein|nr:hypothetical protein [Waddliaceae bacterium]MBT3578360.1 hypothetical protein [Waddliaceae bacterium]MBT4444526.1 hypothetical protein [Waddliaceae bacterium]MBT6928677.1 hypothetical protein [Waddliaceae bacterium]MBT7461321.1 hypothetical protein [Waddliaceae bacterium]